MRCISITDKSRLSTLRRRAHRIDMHLEKSRQRTLHINNWGGLMLIDNYSNSVIEGVDFRLDLDRAEYWIEHYAQKQRR